MLRPDFELRVVSCQSLEMPLPLVGRRGIAQCCAAQGTIEAILRDLPIRWRRPQQRFRLQGSIERGNIVGRKEASLQLSDPVEAHGLRKYRITRQMALELKLIERPIVQRAEFRRQPAECPDEAELRCDDVNDETKTKPSLLRKLEAILDFTLHLPERLSARQEVGVQVDAAVHRKTEVADPVRHRECPMDQVAAGPDMFRPRHHVASEDHTGPGLEALQAAFFDQLIAEPAEPKSVPVVAEVRSGYLPKPYIGDARPVAIAP